MDGTYGTLKPGAFAEFAMSGDAKISGNSVTSDNIVSGYANPGDGGGVYFKSGKTITMRDRAEVSGNTAGSQGGGLYISNASSFVMRNSATISGNTAVDYGGGVFYSMSNIDNSFIMRDKASVSNNSSRLNVGGGVCAYGLFIMQDYASVTANSGGGVYAYGNFIMKGHASVSGNTAEGVAGGVRYHSRNNNDTFTMEDYAEVSNNAVAMDETYAYGGGVYNLGTMIVRGDATVSGNRSAEYGGGVHNTFDSYSIGHLYIQDNAVVSGNTAAAEGGGIWNRAYVYISGGAVYGIAAGGDSNTVATCGASQSGKGAALFKAAGSLAHVQYGVMSADGTTFTSNGDLSTTDDTIRVVNGALQ
jgi:hypothetical protein